MTWLSVGVCGAPGGSTCCALLLNSIDGILKFSNSLMLGRLLRLGRRSANPSEGSDTTLGISALNEEKAQGLIEMLGLWKNGLPLHVSDSYEIQAEISIDGYSFSH